jgi:hypothetical protein
VLILSVAIRAVCCGVSCFACKKRSISEEHTHFSTRKTIGGIGPRKINAKIVFIALVKMRHWSEYVNLLFAIVWKSGSSSCNNGKPMLLVKFTVMPVRIPPKRSVRKVPS